MKSVAKILAAALIGFLLGVVSRMLAHPGQEFNTVYARIQAEQVTSQSQWLHRYDIADSNFREIVKPNVDTIYSTAVLDLAQGNYAITLPAYNNYWSLQVMQQNTDVLGYIGSRGYPDPITRRVEIRSDCPPQVTETKICANGRLWLLARYLVDPITPVTTANQTQDKLQLDRID